MPTPEPLAETPTKPLRTSARPRRAAAVEAAIAAAHDRAASAKLEARTLRILLLRTCAGDRNARAELVARGLGADLPPEPSAEE